MKLERNFTVPVDDTAARKRAVAFLTLLGYRQTGDTDNLFFKRGSAAGSAMSFNPSTWKCDTRVYIKPVTAGAEVAVFYNVGNDPLEESIARELWLDESDFLQKAIADNDFTAVDIKAVTRKVVRNLRYVIGLVVFLLISGAISAWSGIYLFSIGVTSLNAGISASGIFIVLACAIFFIWNRVRPKYRR